MDINNDTGERIHRRIDETHILINNINVSFAEQKKELEHIGKTIEDFISKVDSNVFHPADGCMAVNKSKFAVHDTIIDGIGKEFKKHWGVIMLLLTILAGSLTTVIVTIWKR